MVNVETNVGESKKANVCCSIGLTALQLVIFLVTMSYVFQAIRDHADNAWDFWDLVLAIIASALAGDVASIAPMFVIAGIMKLCGFKVTVGTGSSGR